jgi:hypothetical protein
MPVPDLARLCVLGETCNQPVLELLGKHLANVQTDYVGSGW